MQKPTSTNGRRIAAAMFIGAASTAMVAGTAHADTTPDGGVTGATFDHTEHHAQVTMTDGNDPAALIGLKAPGASGDLWTYCIQETVELRTHETYDEHDWTSESQRIGIDTQHLEGIKWILNNSFPQVDLSTLDGTAGVSSLTDEEAVAATQAAIWTFSDATGKLKLDAANEPDAKVVSLYNWLMTQATGHMNDSGSPQASLTIAPASKATPQAGSKVAFQLASNTSGSFISVTLADPAKTGAKLVDVNGKALDPKATFKSGDTVYVQLPNTPTKGDVHLIASGTVSDIEAGRVFVSHDGKPSQNLILAQAQSTPVSATTDVSWAPATTPPTSPPSTSPTSSPSTAPSTHPSTTTTTPSSTASTPAATPRTTAATPTGGLAHTGAGDTVPLAGGALALLAAGGGMMVYTRRGKKQSTHS
ncbi:thioester domain-containing protein [Catenulispora sp. NF23]|uniref:thioester domain-containing protein n=1 Tax=Catenulispora pinistramenti TaxID=2705254 RepID=UPI001BAA1DD0|nr:thioester domain-containing protein [Catenulispora pinistramenti]MBS2534114.1 thioester domain-containing protein [Catenulispora pinistramenti]